ncbi:hypothetical protein Tco_0573939 [Tanacetum coccineum]
MDTSEKVIHESSSTSDSERTESDTESGTPKGDKVQDLKSMQEDQLDQTLKIHCPLAGPNPEHMDDEFLATAYPKVHENLKLITDEHAYHQRHLYWSLAPPNQALKHNQSPHLSLKITHSPPFIPTAVDNYLGTKLDDALLKSPKEIIKAKKEQGEEKQDSTYSIRSTDEVDIEEFDLKSALFSHMNKKKSANKNKTNYRLYHALMEALIADEDAMDKEVADKVKDHKRKHDSDDDDEDTDDDEGPSAGSNQGTKRRRSDSAASGSAKPPPKADDQSSKKPRESWSYLSSKQHPTLSSTGWQITDTREAGVDSSMHRSDPKSEHSEQSSDDISMQDEGNVSDMEDTDNAHIPKVSTTTWFKPIPESERPATPEPEWTIPPNDFPRNQNITGQMHSHNIILSPSVITKNTNLRKGFQKLPSNDFEDLFLLNIQEKLNHLPQDRQDQSCTQHQHVYKNLVIRKYLGDFKLGIESYQTKINLERPTLVMQPTNYFKEDYTKTQSQEQLSRHRPKLTKETDERLHELHKFLVMVT